MALVCFAGNLAVLGAIEDSAALQPDDQFQVRQTITFSAEDLSFRTMDGFDVVVLEDCDHLSAVGKPWLPSREVKVALPRGMAATGVFVETSTSAEIAGEYTIFPTQRPRRVGLQNSERDWVEPEAGIYNSHRAYPSSRVELVRQTDLAGQGIAVLRINPVQYFPRDKEVVLFTSITFIIEGSSGYQCGDYLPASVSEMGRKSYEDMARGMVINPGKVALNVSDEPQATSVSAGDYDYVIITDSGWTDDFQDLADWKTRKGVPATIVDTTWIYSEYSGSSNQADINLFIRDANSTWGATYFLLGGDTSVVPTHSRTIDGDAIPNDSYYGDYDWDWTTEVHVGRASVINTTAITNFISKVMDYETDPPTSNFAERVGLFGFDLDGYTDGEDNMEYISNNYIPSGWNETTVYDSDAGNHEDYVDSAVNAGQNLIAHVDHCDEYSIGAGSTNHGYYLSTSEVDAFSNNGEWSIFYSIGCWAAAFDYSNCIAEHFVRDTNGGCTGLVGNSRYGWYMQGSTSSYSMLYERYFFRSLFDQNHYKLGNCFTDHKNDGSTSDTTYQYIYCELNLLGDPEMPIWTEDPTGIDSVSFTDPISTGSQSFTVTVTDGGSPVNGAMVCVMKGTEVYEYGTTNTSGQRIFTIAPLTDGYMDVTVTKQNLLPWEGQCYVSSGVIDDTISVSVAAVPTSGTLPFSSQIWIQLTNLTSQPRRAVLKLDLTTGNGSYYSSWRFGWTNLVADEVFTSYWNQNFPNLNPLVGTNLLGLLGEDVTPSPYNQPPYALAGDTSTDSATVTATR